MFSLFRGARPGTAGGKNGPGAKTNPLFSACFQLTGDSPIQPQHAPASSPSAHTRPSPERLDAQIKSINYSQSQLFKVVLERNEELAGLYRGLVDELRDANTQLKVGVVFAWSLKVSKRGGGMR